MTAAAMLGLYDEVSPEVSIIILNFNKSFLTATCLRTLWAKTTGRRYEIIVVDNGSDADEFYLLERVLGDFQLIRLPVNRFFGEGNNIGVQASRGKYVVFLNNDAFVTENWLEPLIDALEQEPHAGGAGPKFLYTEGRVQEAGGFVRSDGLVIQRGKFYDMGSDLDHRTVVDYCSAACFAMTRELFDRVGGFDGNFEPAYYEDTDLCFKIASLGHFVYYCPESVVYHVENATTASLGARLGLHRTVEINRAKFNARWGSYLEARVYDPEARMPPVPPARSRAPNLPSGTAAIAVFYTPFDLIPGGGERYLLTAAAALRQSYRVYVATDAPYSEYRLDYLARELSLDLSGISLITFADLHKLGSIDFFVHLGNHQFPVVPARGRRNVHICQFPFPSHNQNLAALWNNLNGYDEVIVYSRFVYEALVTKLNIFRRDPGLYIVAPPVPIAPAQASPTKQNRPLQIVSIGRFFVGGHNKRHDVMIEAMRQLAADGVDAELHLIGSIHPHPEHLHHFNALTRAAEGLPVHFHANASPAQVDDLLSRAAIYWHAAGFDVDERLSPDRCEHFGISVVEAMAHGCVPFVVENGGPVDFVREGDTGFRYRTIAELVAKTRHLMGHAPALAFISARAQAEAQKFTEAVFVEEWRKIAKRRSLPYGVLPRPFPQPPKETAASSMSPEAARAFIDRFPHWYQNIHLGEGVYTIGSLTHHELVWAEFEKALPKSLEGRSVLDVGCNAGYFSLQVKARSAGRVVGTELIPTYLEQAREISKIWNVEVDYRQMDAHDVGQLNEVFDLVVFAGILYHLKNPLQVIEDLGRLCRDAILLETEFAPDDPYNRIRVNQGRPVEMMSMNKGFMKFIERRELNNDPSNWWVPDAECVMGMLRSAGFTYISRPVVYHGCRLILVASKTKDTMLDLEAFGYPAEAVA